MNKINVKSTKFLIVIFALFFSAFGGLVIVANNSLNTTATTPQSTPPQTPQNHTLFFNFSQQSPMSIGETRTNLINASNPNAILWDTLEISDGLSYTLNPFTITAKHVGEHTITLSAQRDTTRTFTRTITITVDPETDYPYITEPPDENVDIFVLSFNSITHIFTLYKNDKIHPTFELRGPMVIGNWTGATEGTFYAYVNNAQVAKISL